MQQSITERTRRYARSSVPAITALVLVVASMVPAGFGSEPGLTPFFALAAVYFWSIQRPDLMPAWLALTLGLFEDLATAQPLAASGLTLLLVQVITAANRRFFIGRPFAASLYGFALAGGIACPLRFAIADIASNSPDHAPLLPVLVQYALTLGLYPVLAWVLSQCQRLTGALEE